MGRKLNRYFVIPGSYYGTPDDRADRWYIVDREAEFLDKRGPGYKTEKEALERAKEMNRLDRLYRNRRR